MSTLRMEWWGGKKGNCGKIKGGGYISDTIIAIFLLVRKLSWCNEPHILARFFLLDEHDSIFCGQVNRGNDWGINLENQFANPSSTVKTKVRGECAM